MRQVLPQARKQFGADSQRSLGLQLQLSSALQLDGDYAGALEVIGEAATRLERVLGAKHPQTLYAVSYTHLDVYKRQPLARTKFLVCWVKARWGVCIWHGKPIHRAKWP